METETKGGRYHHGDLRNALVQAALSMLEKDGLDRLTLRGVAAAVGVSHAAPGHHFGTLTGLRTALAAIGYARFGASMRAERAAAPDDPAAQMRAARRGVNAFCPMMIRQRPCWAKRNGIGLASACKNRRNCA